MELVEEIAMDVLNKLNRVYVGDLDQQIAKLEQLAKLQYEFYERAPTIEDFFKYKATDQRITELNMERSLCLLRLSPDLLSHLESNDNNIFGF
ncbi:TIR-NBS disease resistance-like protein [Trifolium medium]|uniref:TIR-NBS disease resistance-like protein n=1 Tax=Trifolium medium TaxID=97028 RepID=A0A392SEF5_9FABA|nr:TIR-NBS disease resistance-like protein [Trifolium medium]